MKIKCDACGIPTVQEKSCPRCRRPLKDNYCGDLQSRRRHVPASTRQLQRLGSNASANLGCQPPKMLRGVKGLTNLDKTPEMIEKGILRAKHGVSTYKDGTIRFDGTNAPLTHITPAEIGVSIEKMHQMGYLADTHGLPLTDPNQVCELKIQDVVIPVSAGEYFIQIAAFIDDLLTRVYKLPPILQRQETRRPGWAPHLWVGASHMRLHIGQNRRLH